MKKTIYALTFAASLGLAACSNPGDEVIVSSEVGDLTQEEFYNEVKKLAGPQLLKQVVVEKVMNDKYEVTDEEIEAKYEPYVQQYGNQLASVLEENGYTEESFKQSLRFTVLQEKAQADVKVTDEEVQKYYDQASQELHARHILVATEEEAKEIIKELEDGGDFAAIAKEKSTDTASGAEGGDLGWFSVGKMVEEFNDAAYALELNTISEPVKSDFGYHIIEVLEKRPVEGYGTLEEKKDEISETLLNAKKADWPAIQSQLLKEANVEVKDEDLKIQL